MMKECDTKDLKPGMVIAEDIYTKEGQLILQKNVTLTQPLIERLKFYNITSAVVTASADEEPAAAVPPKKHAVQEASYSQKVMRSKEFQNFQLNYSKVLAAIKDEFEGYVYHNTPLNTDALLNVTRELYLSCKTSLELFDMLHNMRSTKDSVYAHSLNVSLISRRIGRWLKFDAADLDTLTLAGLLHDIGKLKIPEEILEKPGKYTDEEFQLVKQHPKFGYDILKSLPLDTRIKKTALSHHERCDGTGYPMGLTQDDTNDFAMVVAIADVYDAMTAARAYRSPLCPFQVIANFEHDGLSKYKPQFILTFLSHIASTYQNNRVILNDGRVANIVMLNNNRLSKPVVQFSDNTCLDLSTASDLYIQSLL